MADEIQNQASGVDLKDLQEILRLVNTLPIIATIPTDPPKYSKKIMFHDDSGNNRLLLFFKGKYTSIGNIKSKSGVDAWDVSTTGTQTIAHGLGSIPKRIKIEAILPQTTVNSRSSGLSDGTVMSCMFEWYQNSSTTSNYVIYLYDSAGSTYSRATISVDATNITLTWSKSGSPTGTATLLWEASI